ncbi:hypothetical protein BDV96DRAFT_653913 [Lophiotrema nucula]|uniref:JmjC domain-containing protein n=1 Tax=Lophiotrema nucula TaxID=690887 RepID=A0A6A5YJH0_9PLEO|nr:hypothetical protein BDV96DRAFT_653913 [Lophiotrema nucula]
MADRVEPREIVEIRKELTLHQSQGAQNILDLVDHGSSITGAYKSLQSRGLLSIPNLLGEYTEVQPLSKSLQLVWKATGGFYYELTEEDAPEEWVQENLLSDSFQGDDRDEQEEVEVAEDGRQIASSDSSGITIREQMNLKSCLENNIPTILGEEELPWRAIPDLRSVQDDLIKSLNRDKPRWSLVPPTDDEDQDLQAVKDLISKLSVEDHQALTSVFDLESHILDEVEYLTPASVNEWKGQLAYTDWFKCCILPVGVTRELNTYWSHQVSTLLYGHRVWVIYPQNYRNLDIFEQYKLGRLPGNVGVLRSLKDAVVCLQIPGETVVIPPFCAFTVLATRMSLSADYEIRLASNLLQRLQNIDHVNKLCDALQDTEGGRFQKRTFAEELYNDLLLVLKNRINDETEFRDKLRKYDSRDIIKRLGMCWISHLDNLRDLFLEAGKQSWAEKIAEAWANAMIGKGKADKTQDADCMLCEESFEWRRRTKEEMRRLIRRHFVEAHWQGDADSTRLSPSE